MNNNGHHVHSLGPLIPSRLIKLGHEFESGHEKEWPDSKKISHLHQLASSLNHALDLMQQERDALVEKATFLETQLANSEQDLSQQKSILVQNITESNQRHQALAEQVQQLTNRILAQDAVIERLNNGSEHQLGD